MLSFRALPLILISATDAAAAKTIISEIVKGADFKEDNDGSCVWVIDNKYYRASVRLVPHLDAECLVAAPDQVEAHVIYIQNSKGENENTADQRLASVGTLTRCEVQLVVSEDAVSDALDEWAVRAQYEAVSLTGEEEDGGVARVISALHAHLWRGLQRHDTSINVPTVQQRMDDFLELMGSLSQPPPSMDDAQRKTRAELMLAAMFRNLDDDDDDDALDHDILDLH